MATPVNIAQGLAVSVANGGGAGTLVFPAGINGGKIINPPTAADQGISPAENLYVNPISDTPGVVANGTTLVLYPGQVWEAIPGQTTPTYVAAATTGHKFTAFYW